MAEQPELSGHTVPPTGPERDEVEGLKDTMRKHLEENGEPGVLPNHPLCQHEQPPASILNQLLRERDRNIRARKELAESDEELARYEEAARMLVHKHGPFVIKGVLFRTTEGGTLQVEAVNDHEKVKVAFDVVPCKGCPPEFMKSTET